MSVSDFYEIIRANISMKASYTWHYHLVNTVLYKSVIRGLFFGN